MIKQCDKKGIYEFSSVMTLRHNHSDKRVTQIEENTIRHDKVNINGKLCFYSDYDDKVIINSRYMGCNSLKVLALVERTMISFASGHLHSIALAVIFAFSWMLRVLLY